MLFRRKTPEGATPDTSTAHPLGAVAMHEEQLVSEQCERAAQALTILEQIPAPATAVHERTENIADYDEREEAERELFAALTTKLHSQEGPGMIGQSWTALGGQPCTHCRDSVTDAGLRVVAFEKTTDVVLVEDDGMSNMVMPKANPEGRIHETGISGQEKHVLIRHPELPAAQSVTEKLLALAPYQNPALDLLLPDALR